MRKLWEDIRGQAIALYPGLLLGQWGSYRDQGPVLGGRPQEGDLDDRAASQGRLQARVSEGQQAYEEQRNALFDVGGVEGDPLAYREKDTQDMAEIKEITNYNCQRPDGSYLYSQMFRDYQASLASVLDKVKPMTPEAQARKDTPIFSGVLQYFPKALAEVARVSKVGNDQHNPGKPLHWDRSKSGDELDALTRHLVDAGTMDTDGTRHSAKVAWRALANLEKELENE